MGNCVVVCLFANAQVSGVLRAVTVSKRPETSVLDLADLSHSRNASSQVF